MSFPMLGFALAVGAAVLAAGCAPEGKDSRSVGSVFNPYCMPDGSVVRYQYSDTKGSFEGARGSPENCPWNK